ncbi:unnamed protein product [Timema podura]|uniref:Uncharacterized protein n=1 Tax=Timema podura TaxID=61482 RepID=A0ABN7PIW4_TIMPD|nr:unnamed protein product [Timema podura]
MRTTNRTSRCTLSKLSGEAACQQKSNNFIKNGESNREL